MWRHIASNALTFFVVALFLAGGAVGWGLRQYSAPGPLAQAICLQVRSGANFREVGNNLVAEGAVSSGFIFGTGVDYAGLGNQLKAGSYLIPVAASMEEIAGIVTRGGASTCGSEIVLTVGVARNLMTVRSLDPATARFTELARFDPALEEIPEAYTELRGESDTQYRVQVVEGVTTWQVVQALNGFEVLSGEVAEIPPEGMLAPGSYAVVEGAEVAPLVQQMQGAQEAILAEEWANRSEGLPFATPEEALTLASIIEKETAVPDERPVVSSVLVNRIVQGWRLQFDPTIIYGITRGEGILDRPITQSDIAGTTESRLHGQVEYNTYVVDGLPAGPIAIPGRAAINAALNPAATDYMFFVATGDGTGSHAFATTLDEHNANVARWRAVEAGQSGN